MTIGQDPGRASPRPPATETFRMVPDRLWTHPDLQPFDLKLWCCLSFLARGRGRCEATDARLARQTGASPQTVRRALLRLERARFIGRTMDGPTRVIRLHPEGSGEPIAAFALKVTT